MEENKEVSVDNSNVTNQNVGVPTVETPAIAPPTIGAQEAVPPVATPEIANVEPTPLMAQETPVVEGAQPQVDAAQPAATTTSEVAPTTGKKKINPLILGIAALAVILIGAGVFLLLTGGGSKKETKTITAADFNGIYMLDTTKMYLVAENDQTIRYTLDGNGLYNGTATVADKVATSVHNEDGRNVYKFTLTDEGINLEIENNDTLSAVGSYKKIADYNKVNVYKEAVGDPQYLSTKFTGIFRLDDAVIKMYQTTENKVFFEATKGTDFETSLFLTEVFEVQDENTLVAKSFFSEEVVAYTITIDENKTLTLTINTEAEDYDENLAPLSGTYTFEKSFTMEEIMEEYFRFY